MTDEKNNADEEERRKALESQILQAHMSELNKQVSEIESKRQELKNLKDALTGLDGQKGRGTLIPIGSGVLVKGEITEDEKVIVNVGSSVFVEKTPKEAKEIIDEQLKELSSISEQLQQQMQKYSMNQM